MDLTPEQIAEGWIEHRGGRQPCGRCKVSVMFRDGTIRGNRNPLSVPWEHRLIGMEYPELHIIAYRKEPT